MQTSPPDQTDVVHYQSPRLWRTPDPAGRPRRPEALHGRSTAPLASPGTVATDRTLTSDQ